MPLKPIIQSKKAGDPYIECLGCGRRVSHSFAAMMGWTYDTEGPPFLAYFCPLCGKKESNHEPANTDPGIPG